MWNRIHRFRLVTIIAVAVCVGLILGSVLSITPTRVSGQTAVDVQSDLYQKLYQQVNPSVVNIRVHLSGSGAGANQSGGGPQSGQGGEALGSGFVYDKDGHIVTNAHVVDGSTLTIVTFTDDSQYEATLTGIDKDADIAVIKVDPAAVANLTPLSLADSDQAQIGQRVIAIGNPFGLNGSMSQGIVSGLHRSVDSLRPSGSNQGTYAIPDVIQTDAAINPGNSGGPLLNLNGELLGMNSQIAVGQGADQSAGVGLAVPSNLVKIVADALIKDGKIQHSMLGVTLGTLNLETNRALKLDDNLRGALVEDVSNNSPASRAGLKATLFDNSGNPITIGDVIIAIDGVTVKSNDDLIGYLFIKTQPGQTVKLTILRGGQQMELSVVLTARPTIK